MELYYDVHGGTGPYLLMVHGYMSSRAQWDLNLPALTEVVRPVVLELWGHGRSPAPEDTTLYHPDAYVERFERLREELGAERWLLCGQSLGAALTLRYSLTYPYRVIAQVFTNSSSALADAQWAVTRKESAEQQIEAIARLGHAALETFRMHPKQSRRLPAEAKAALVADAQMHHAEGVARTVQHTTLNSPLRDRVKDIRVPTLLVCGEDERRFAPHRQFAAETIPGLQIAGAKAGHAVNIEASDLFNAAVTDFIHQHV